MHIYVDKTNQKFVVCHGLNLQPGTKLKKCATSPEKDANELSTVMLKKKKKKKSRFPRTCIKYNIYIHYSDK